MKKDLYLFANSFSSDNFDECQKLFLNLYLEPYLKLKHESCSKSLSQFKNISDYIVYKYDCYIKFFNLNKENALNIVLFELPLKLCNSIIKNGGLESVAKAVRLSKVADSVVEKNYSKEREQTNTSLVELARKESEQNIEHVFKNFNPNSQQTVVPTNSITSSMNNLAATNRELIKKKRGRPSAAELAKRKEASNKNKKQKTSETTTSHQSTDLTMNFSSTHQNNLLENSSNSISSSMESQNIQQQSLSLASSNSTVRTTGLTPSLSEMNLN